MGELLALWNVLRQLGDVASLGILVVLLVIWRNDLAHVAKDVAWLKEKFIEHLEMHAKEKE